MKKALSLCLLAAAFLEIDADGIIGFDMDRKRHSEDSQRIFPYS